MLTPADEQRRDSIRQGRAGWRYSDIVDSHGRLINHADAVATTVEVASRLGRLYRSYWAGQVPAGTTYDFIVRPPVGIHLYGTTRASTVLEGRLDTQFLVGGSYSSVESSADGYNFDETLGDIAQTKLERVSGLTGASQRSSGAPIISPSTGPTVMPSAQTVAGAHPKFDNIMFPVFRYANPGGAAVSLWIDIIWEETPAE